MNHRLVAAILLSTALPAWGQSIYTFAGGGTDDGRPATVAAISDLAGIATDSNGNLYLTDPLLGLVRRVDSGTGLIETIAGVGTLFGLSGDGGPATLAELGAVRDIAVSPDGSVYTAESGVIRRIDGATGIITTFAGGGSSDPGDGGPATNAKLGSPAGVSLDATGNVFFADEETDRVRRVDIETGIIWTVAGIGSEGFAGDGGPATEATLFDPSGIAIDSVGNLWIADRGNHRIRKVGASSGIISTIAGTGAAGFSGDGGLADLAQIESPIDVAIDGEGNLWIADRGNHRCRRVDGSGIIETTAGNGSTDFSGDGAPATEAGIGTLTGVAVDSSMNVFLASDDHDRVRRVDAQSGLISSFAGNGQGFFWGDGAPATSAGVWLPGGVAVDASGNVYIGSWLRIVRKVDARTGIITVFAGGGEPGSGGDGGPARSAQLSRPTGLAVDSAGNLYIADRESHRVRKVNASNGTITTVAGGGAQTGNGIPATQARLAEPHGIAVDDSGNLYIADSRAFVVRKVDAATGTIQTVAGNGTPIGDIFFDDGFDARLAGIWPEDVAVDSEGDLYIADYLNASIRKVDRFTRVISTVAGSGFPGYDGDGGPATEATLFDPVGIAFDDSDNLFIADQFNNRVRRVARQSGIITTVTGNGDWAYSGDGGAASRARVTFVNGVAADTDGALYISDLSSNRIRIVRPCIALAPPVLTSPSDGSSGISPAPRLSWGETRGSVRYDVLLDTANPPSRLAAADVDTTSLSPSNLDSLTTYYWRVVAKGDPYCEPESTTESEVRSFTTTSSCNIPGGSGAQ